MVGTVVFKAGVARGRVVPAITDDLEIVIVTSPIQFLKNGSPISLHGGDRFTGGSDIFSGRVCFGAWREVTDCSNGYINVHLFAHTT